MIFKDADSKGELNLNDRWFNPTDVVASHFAPFTIPLDPKNLKIRDNKSHLIEIEWDLNRAKPTATVFVDKRKRMTIPLSNKSLQGISYLHLLSSKDSNDIGYLIEWVKAEEI